MGEARFTSSMPAERLRSLSEAGAPEDAAWSVSVAAQYLGISPKTLYKWAADATVPSIKLGGRLRFSPSELAAWRAARQRGGEG